MACDDVLCSGRTNGAFSARPERDHHDIVPTDCRQNRSGLKDVACLPYQIGVVRRQNRWIATKRGDAVSGGQRLVDQMTPDRAGRAKIIIFIVFSISELNQIT